MKNLQRVSEHLLAANGITEDNIAATVGSMMNPNIDYADLYFQYSRHESWSMEEGIIKSGNFGIDQGVGVRAISGDKTGFAYSDAIELNAINHAAGVAKSIAIHPQDKVQRITCRPNDHAALYIADDPLLAVSNQDKMAILQRADQAARDADPSVTQVMVSLAAVQDEVLVLRSDGHLAADVRPLVRLNVSVIVEANGRREQGFNGGGGRYTLDYFLHPDRVESFAREAVRVAMVNLDAVAAPAGEMTVVLASGWPGILLHEAIGHGLEGDFNRKGSSAFSGRVGEQVASPLCTVVDDGTLADRRGSLTVDDEGTPSENTVLIENGILKGYMQDRMNARLMDVAPTGNGRRESYAHLPMPRMTNTYMHAGKDDPNEIIASVKNGVYAVSFGGGQVDITSGKFVFSTTEAYLIEDGKITAPLKGASLIGNGPDVLTRVSMVGNDMALDSGVGVCGKNGQSVPVGVGQPTLKIDNITVGGAAA